MKIYNRNGLGLIDVLVSLAILVMISSGFMAAYSSVLNTINNSHLRTEAKYILNKEVETIRNIPYEQVGTVGGIPSGVLLPEKTTTSTGGNLFVIKTTVRNIDDPFDGTFGGSPNDTAPADYKLVQLEATCPTCFRFNILINLTTTVAPKNLESASNEGSLFVNVFDAVGAGVSGATVKIINNSTTPTINLTDTTNASGVLQLIGVPTSTQNYKIFVSKSNYSSEQTYPINDPSNPNPVKPDATVSAQTLTQLSFAIDKTSSLKITTSDNLCSPIANQNFNIAGFKLIGAAPDILKFPSANSSTDSQGIKNITNLEWDNYSLNYTGSLRLSGTNPLSPIQINPNSNNNFNFVFATSSPSALLVTVKDLASGSGITNATVTLAKTGFSQTLTTGHNFFSQSDWPAGQYSSQNLVDVSSSPETVKLIGGENGYTTSTGWLISPTFNIGSSTGKFYTINWNPVNQPPQTGADSIKFQIATNNDDQTWNFLGPDNTENTFYTANNSVISNVHDNQKYFRYKVFLKTDDPTFTPSLDDLSIEFNGFCVPSYQSFFDNLNSGNYTVQASAVGYQMASTTVNVSNPWQSVDLLLSP